MRPAEKLAWYISHHFDSDEYTTAEQLEPFEWILAKDGRGEIIGYLVFEDDGEHLNGIRSGVKRSERGKQIGLKLYRRMLKLAKRRGRVYRTYVYRLNLASINAHVRAGMRITKIDDEWVYVSGPAPEAGA